ncbi:transmembrane amino acid transporter protein-domain-containing protein [Lipomyces arxii]|uniref:transmembrane amino acid transporter protein-domain-containing protein n=1 Tax=Lipomyces arxii TaxID=56418 RepID=UPI0034CFDCE2
MMSSRSIDIPRRTSIAASSDFAVTTVSGSGGSSDASATSMATASSNLESPEDSGSRPMSSFPVTHIGSSTNLPQLAPDAASIAPSQSRNVLSAHQFGSVPASSTSVLFPGVINASPARSVHSASITPQGTAPDTPNEYDPNFVRAIGRHLVSPKPSSPSTLSSMHLAKGLGNGKSHSRTGSVKSTGSNGAAQPANAGSNDVDQGSSDVDPNFYSLSLQGGDITRELYNWQRAHEETLELGTSKRGRSKSFTNIPRPDVADETLNMNSIHVPGGFRRNYLLSKAKNNSQQVYDTNADYNGEGSGNVNNTLDDNSKVAPAPPRPFLTRNFLEFLSVYGHFAGEELEEEDEDYDGSFVDFDDASTTRSVGNGSIPNGLRRQYTRGSETSDDDASFRSMDEESVLLTGKRAAAVASGRHHGQVVQDTSATKAVLLLLKGFVGTGVLFLPKAYYNGGMLFSSAILFFVAVLTYYCFILLIDSRMRVQASFGDMGGILYGKQVRLLILTSIVLSQIGFAAAYTVFTSENLQAFILAITDCKVFVPVRYLIFLQMIVFIPLSMVRNISKLSVSALVADFFILLGLAYVYFWDGRVLVEHGVSDIAAFNSQDWTLFIGTAIFTFEGIGLVIPIHESMKKPKQFYSAIGLVMAIITFVYIVMGVMSYAAYGSNVETVVILNMPQDNRLVNSVQFIYAMAILLSTPLQLFPAIRIMENAWFVKSGKHDMRAKWHKNIFRTAVVLVTLFVAWGGADDLDKFVALIGSFACIPLTYIYPPLLHYRACARTFFQKSMDITILVFGLLSMMYTTINTIQSWATSKPDNDFFRYCA